MKRKLFFILIAIHTLTFSQVKNQKIAIKEASFTTQLKSRLEILNQNTPFYITYNPVLEQLIKTYLGGRQKTITELMTKADYYFPLIENQLLKYNLPPQMKYLAVIESALQPLAKSKVGATGLWQFTSSTGKIFDLKMNSYIDERSDPLKSTEAACLYLLKLYNIFNDWDLVLAAYNFGPGNLTKAIKRSGGVNSYKKVKPYLPLETRSTITTFYAMMYLFEYSKEHEIYPNVTTSNFYGSDTINVKNELNLKQISAVLNTDITTLKQLNPQYRLGIIPFVEGANYTLRLPSNLKSDFIANADSIYSFAKRDNDSRKTLLPKYFESENLIKYTVKKGDNLGSIAKKFGVNITNIKHLNHLKDSKLSIGQHLNIAPKNFETTSKTEFATKGENNIYKVKNGDTLWGIAKKYPNISLKQLKEWNHITDGKQLKPGAKLKLYKS